MATFSDLINSHLSVIEKLHALTPQLEKIAQKLIEAAKADHTIFWMGNGGSAADAQHMAAELVGRFKQERRAIKSIALTTDTSILTAIANDYSFDHIFARQLEGLCRENDVVVGISTSGNSQNVIQGFRMAKEKGAYTIGLTGGKGGELKMLADDCLVVPEFDTAHIQEAHLLIEHGLCQMIEDEIAL